MFFPIYKNKLTHTHTRVCAERIDVTFNNLDSNVPTTIGELSQLEYLVLKSNEFTGTLPTEMGRLTNLGEFIVEEIFTLLLLLLLFLGQGSHNSHSHETTPRPNRNTGYQ